ncbi:MAG: methylated-DNA--[protein]-cysteine S-methyltransferase, partial [Actinomycetia bacterium]|nr:methylated-DNA--[protein]-cysteine S-methyltransferase [Actinomycetes bacterium]
MDGPTYCHNLSTPLGEILVSSDGQALTGLWFVERERFAPTVEQRQNWLKCSSLPIFQQLRDWLTAYFQGEQPRMDLPLNPRGSEFQLLVWQHLRSIPYGQTTSYGQLARQLQFDRPQRPRPAAQA